MINLIPLGLRQLKMVCVDDAYLRITLLKPQLLYSITVEGKKIQKKIRFLISIFYYVFYITLVLQEILSLHLDNGFL